MDTIFIIKTLDLENDKMENLIKHISLDRKNKIKKLFKKNDKIQTMIAEILIRTQIINKFNIANKNIYFNENGYGKKRLVNFDKFYFNISHSGKYVVVGISTENIGVDIEEIKEIEYEEIAKNFFTNNEIEYINKNNEKKQLDKFYEIWTLKESYIKNRGQGLSIVLDSFDISIKDENLIEIIDKNLKDNVSFTQIDILNGYKLAICSEKDSSFDIDIINQDKLIDNFLNLLEREANKV